MAKSDWKSDARNTLTRHFGGWMTCYIVWDRGGYRIQLNNVQVPNVVFSDRDRAKAHAEELAGNLARKIINDLTGK